jgi:hypothetical protein
MGEAILHIASTLQAGDLHFRAVFYCGGRRKASSSDAAVVGKVSWTVPAQQATPSPVTRGALSIGDGGGTRAALTGRACSAGTASTYLGS